MSSWYMNTVDKDGIAVSTRVRLARNVRKVPFPKMMNNRQKTDMLEEIKNFCDGAEIKNAGKLKYIDMSILPAEETGAMVERHIISPDFAKIPGPKGLVINDDESISVMLMEEDHIRIQVILPGLQTERAYEIASEVEDLFCKNLDIAFDSKLGFLTECPTNLGTGLRASVMLHLPILERVGVLNSIADSVSKIGLTVRGTYGEGSDSLASLYQLSNQVTLGISEKAATENLTAITAQIIDKEKSAREQIEKETVEDIVYRALGVLKYARKLSSEEMMKQMSKVKLGVSMGILKNIEASLPLQLIIETEPSSLQKINGRMTPEDRDVIRAKIIRERIRNVE